LGTSVCSVSALSPAPRPPLLRNCDLEVGPVGSADKAVRYLVELMGARLLACAELARALAGDLAENAPEGAETVPAGLECDLDDRRVRVAEQRLGPLDATRQQIAVRRNAEGFFESPRKVRAGAPADVGEPLDWPILFRGGVHVVLRAQQAAQQCRVLASHRGVSIACFRGVGEDSPRERTFGQTG